MLLLTENDAACAICRRQLPPIKAQNIQLTMANGANWKGCTTDQKRSGRLKITELLHFPPFVHPPPTTAATITTTSLC